MKASAATAIHRKRPSAPVRANLLTIMQAVFNTKSKQRDSRVIDWGCGYGADVFFLSRLGVRTLGYDPYQEGWTDRPTEDERTTTVLLSTYVLNVLGGHERAEVVNMMKRRGRVILATVRRDLKEDRKPGKNGTTQYIVTAEWLGKHGFRLLREKKGCWATYVWACTCCNDDYDMEGVVPR